jgi:dipeptidyl aminopeptidase/acylaminoacyl peptidase
MLETSAPSPEIPATSSPIAGYISLPSSLYFLEGSGEESQVWRLTKDGLARVQITSEKAGVDDFAVSPADGSLAIVSNNQLFLLDNDGKNRRLVADGHEAKKEDEDYFFRGLIEKPVFSPAGRTLAFGFDGLHLYNITAGEDRHVLTNLGNLLGETFVYSKEAYHPGPWSPDGKELLIIMTYYEGSTLAVMEPEAEQPFRRLWSSGPVCCLFSWTGDSRSVLVANPYYTGSVPGLWRYDADTGAETVLIPGLRQDGSIDFTGWLQQLPSGELLFFQSNLERFSPDVGIPMMMTRSDAEGSNRIQIRPEQFQIITALWAQDGSLAVVLQTSPEGGRQLILVRTDGSPLQVLLEGQLIRDFSWGP